MKPLSLMLGLALLGAALLAGCQQKTTRKTTIETPEKKYEIEVEKTEKK